MYMKLSSCRRKSCGPVDSKVRILWIAGEELEGSSYKSDTDHGVCGDCERK